MASVAAFALPAGLFLVLTFMRPDLMRPMLGHIFGTLLFGGVLLFTLLGAGAQLVVALAKGENQTTRTLIGVAGFLLCTLPAMFALLFGPIVFAFMFGPME